jgi:hypothetical protein
LPKAKLEIWATWLNLASTMNYAKLEIWAQLVEKSFSQFLTLRNSHIKIGQFVYLMRQASFPISSHGI